MTSCDIFWPAMALAALCVLCVGYLLYQHCKDANL